MRMLLDGTDPDLPLFFLGLAKTRSTAPTVQRQKILIERCITNPWLHKHRNLGSELDSSVSLEALKLCLCGFHIGIAALVI